MPLDTITRVQEVGMRDINRYLDAGFVLLNISNYAKAAAKPDKSVYVRKGISYVVGWDGLESAPDMSEPTWVPVTEANGH